MKDGATSADFLPVKAKEFFTLAPSSSSGEPCVPSIASATRKQLQLGSSLEKNKTNGQEFENDVIDCENKEEKKNETTME